MKDLNQLFNKYGLNKLSHGCSTGSEWFSSGEKIESYSPVNGKLIGEISSGSKNDFDHILLVGIIYWDAMSYWAYEGSFSPY